MDDAFVYPYSAEEALRRNESALWRASHKANVACKKAIEEAIRRDFDGMHLNEGCLQSVLKEFGYKRVKWVLANTLREKEYDGRFSPANREWAERAFIPPDRSHNGEFAADSHPAVLDGFVNMYRKAYEELGLFGGEYCEPGSRAELDYEGKVLVLSPDILKESCWTPRDQLWYAHDGFGCKPHATGRSIRCTCLWDGETARWNRTDFVGVLKEKFLPVWASEKLEELQGQKQSGMTMK